MLAVIGIVYGALVAMVQPDMKKLVAYSSVSHLGLRRARHLRDERAGRAGRGLPDAEPRRQHRRALPHRRHAVGPPPHAADRGVRRAEGGDAAAVAAFLLITLASIGLPGLNGFVGEFLILLGAFRWDPRFAAFAATGVILSAVYMLWMFQRVNYGPVTNDEEPDAAGPDGRASGAVIVPIVAMAIVMGVLPSVFLRADGAGGRRASLQRVQPRAVAQAPPVAAGRGRRRARRGRGRHGCRQA